MGADSRHAGILDALRRRGGYAGIEELASGLSVTPQTIRRDLSELAEKGLLRRHHGGASLPSSIANTDYAVRHVENSAAKQRIARAAAALIPDGSSLFLTLGTTVEATAAALAATHRDLLVVTNSSAAARILGAAPGMQVHLLGGVWQARNGGLTGATAAEMAGRWRCDALLTGGGAIGADGWLLDYHEDEVAVARAMLARAGRLVIVADSAKFHRAAPCRVAQPGRGGMLVTEAAAPAATGRALRAAGAEIVIA
ncbi:DeoR/GlpR transcriptional regulator [Belnapia sp. T6]|uniref:DeoR/GlpR transcriptional regulator n=1 Tax=Belnapia mucosa TaxID=2804532 RepID=A0ABS1V911_9PROT|nr:DeoR/GlpR family DNA-binding transcription regulator [Belnapia mucosa]MBL6457234.1 DeoR/GlpR transcriptional regulator [Belnapia mucosa]